MTRHLLGVHREPQRGGARCHSIFGMAPEKRVHPVPGFALFSNATIRPSADHFQLMSSILHLLPSPIQGFYNPSNILRVPYSAPEPPWKSGSSRAASSCNERTMALALRAQSPPCPLWLWFDVTSPTTPAVSQESTALPPPPCLSPTSPNRLPRASAISPARPQTPPPQCCRNPRSIASA